jgi:hypothetical protein
MKTEIRHTQDGEMMYRLLDAGWDTIKTSFSHSDSRCTGGWWMYKGDHDEALALLEPIKKDILQRIVWVLA